MEDMSRICHIYVDLVRVVIQLVIFKANMLLLRNNAHFLLLVFEVSRNPKNSSEYFQKAEFFFAFRELVE